MDDETLLALKENGGVMQTVALRGYVKTIYRKLGVHSRIELVRRVHGQK